MNKLLVTMTACKRPEYTIRSIRGVRLAGYRGPILVSLDWVGPESDVVANAIEAESIQTRLEIPVRVNKPALGLWGPNPVTRSDGSVDFLATRRAGDGRNNAWAVYDWAFEERNAPAILAIEDDCIVSPDALELCQWFIEHGSEYLFLSLANNTPNEGGRPLDLWESCHINSPWAWCFTETSWRKIRRRWNSKTETPVGWDWSLTYNMAANRWKSLVPALPRARNIGANGSSTEGERWWREHLQDVEVSDGTYGSDYRIMPSLAPETITQVPDKGNRAKAVHSTGLNWSEPWMHEESVREGVHV